MYSLQPTLLILMRLYFLTTFWLPQMMIVATIVPNYLMGIIIGARIQGLMILVGGFFRLPNDIPKPL